MALVGVTNQSGIGRGYYTEDDYQAITTRMRARFIEEGAPLEAVYHCPFHPDAVEARYRDADHAWRKPRPGMILAARDEVGLDLARSALLGDRAVDLLAGHAAGVGALGLIGGAEISAEGLPSFERFADLGPVPAWLERLR
jgi:D-glycero-D-manno-heptose 1,7-bisphosphate phosphatase